MSVHDDTFDPSTGIKHAVNLLCLMRTIIGTNEPPCPSYLVVPDTNGGGDHNHKHVRNQISLFSLFILGNMENRNVTCGCPGFYFPNTSERAMALLNIVLSGLVLKSNFQVGDKLLVDEVIDKAPSIKSVGSAVQEYYTGLPLSFVYCCFGAPFGTHFRCFR